MRRTLLTLVLVGALALAGCGDDDTSDADAPGAGSGSGAGEAAATPECIGPDEDLLDEYVGLSEDEAADLAEEQGRQLREVGRDGECAVVTMDLRDDRVNVEYVDEVVVAAAIF